MPAMRVYFPSVAPVDIVATRGTPGQAILKVFSMAWVTSGSSGEGGTAAMVTFFPSVVRCGTMLILTFGSFATRSRVLRTSSGSSPGKIRQLTDGVVRARDRAMTAGIQGFELVIGVDFFAGLKPRE